MLLVEVHKFWTDTRYDIDILHQRDKSVKTKRQKVLGLNPRLVEVEQEKLGERGAFSLPHPE